METQPELACIPVIDIQSLIANAPDREAVVTDIRRACQELGFFYVVGHGVDEGLQQQLHDLSHQFFAQDLATKLDICMAKGGRAWRGYFPVGDELTSGKPDLKEGLYFGEELTDDHPSVRAGLPMHGRNLFPTHPPGFREVVLAYMAAMTDLGQRIMGGIALSLGLEDSYFLERYTWEPLTLFRIFNYPALPHPDSDQWSVGEHTDYGLLTILKQDDAGGLQIKSNNRWLDAPPIHNSFVCNIGDMLDRITGGLYRSTPHRVRNKANRDRLSFPFFFDPNFAAEIHPIVVPTSDTVQADKQQRWDRASVHDIHGTYGDYILSKVSKVFPDLHQAIL